MNATLIHTSTGPAMPPFEAAFPTFKAQNHEEQVVAGIVRSMLYYHILRTQLEGSKPWMQQQQRLVAKRYAIAIRTSGFAAERRAVEEGIRIDYDDEMLRLEGTKIAYLLCRDQIEEAMANEEMIVAISVDHSLYETSLEAFSIAA
jgi:hypothetical protein